MNVTYVRLCVFCSLLLGVAGSAVAFDDGWVVQMRVSDLNGGNSGVAVICGTGEVSTAFMSNPPPTLVAMYMPVAGEDDPYFKDIRAAEVPEVTMTWSLYVSAGADYAGSSFKLRVWNTDIATNSDLDDNPGFVVRLYKGDHLEYQFDPLLNGTSDAPQWSKEYPILPGQTIDDFRLVREIPEPSALLGLLSGLVGVGGVLVRRRG